MIEQVRVYLSDFPLPSGMHHSDRGSIEQWRAEGWARLPNGRRASLAALDEPIAHPWLGEEVSGS